MIASAIGSKFTGSRFVRSVAILAGGTALGQLLVVVSAPFLTRLYEPADFGVLTIYVSLLSFLLGLASLRYHLAIPLASDTQSTSTLLMLCSVVLAGMVLLTAMAVLAFGSSIASWVNAPELEPLLWLLPIGLAGAGAMQMLTAWAVRGDRYGDLARVRIGQSASMVGMQLGLGLISQGSVGLLIGDALGRAAGSLRLARLAWNDLHPHVRVVSFRAILTIAGQYRRFPLISSWTSVVGSAGSQLPTLMIAGTFGASVVGWFGLCQRLLSMSFVLVASSIGTVYLSESSKLVQDHPEKLMRLYWSTVSRSTMFAVPLTALVVIAAPHLFGPVLGREWNEAGRYAQVLAFSAGFQFVNRTVGSACTVVERQDLDLFGEIVFVFGGPGALLVGRSIDASAMETMVLFSAAASLGSLFGIGLSWYAIFKHGASEGPATHMERTEL